MTVIRRCRCGKPLRDVATVCDPCTRALENALGNVPWVADELNVTYTRQHAAPITSTGSSATTLLPWDERAARATRALDATLRRWVRITRDEHIGTSFVDDPAKDPAAMSRWLLCRVPALTHHDRGPAAAEQLVHVVTRAERVVFWKPRTRIYLGPCAYGSGVLDQLSRCPGDVYAEEGEPVGTCADCGRGVSVVVRQSELDNDLRGRLLSAAEIADWAMRMGLDAKRDEVRRRVLYWHRHHRIQAAAVLERGNTKIPLFRYGDVRLLLDLEYAS